MKAWQYSSVIGGLEKNLRLAKNLTLPSSWAQSSKGVLVEVISASVNPADYKFPEVPVVGSLMVKKPATPGMDFSGRVVRPNGNYKEGELVFGRLPPGTRYGSLSQFVLAPKAGLAKLHADIDPTHAAGIGTAGLTAYQSIVPYVNPGDSIFINGGSGGVGTFAIQLAKIMGCHVVTCCSSANVQLCGDLGADQVIDYKTSDVVSELKQRGQVFDLVVDAVGTRLNLHSEAESFLKPGRPFHQIGSALNLQAMMSMLRSLLLPVFLGGPKPPFKFIATSSDAEKLSKMADWTSSGQLKVVIDSIYSYDEAPRAFERLRTGRARGKIIVNHEH